MSKTGTSKMLGGDSSSTSTSRMTSSGGGISGQAFDNIYLAGKNGPQSLGKLKMAPPGIGFQEAGTKNLLTIPANEVKKITWLRCARDFELKFELKSGVVHKFDGFQRDAHDLIAAHTKSVYGITLDSKDLSYRGYNWGKAEFQGNHMIFNVANKPAFEIPLADVAGATLSGKHEVSLELVNPIPAREPGSKPQRVKEDMLVEIQFYIPGMVTASQVDEAVDGKKLLRDRDSALVTSTANGKSREEGEIQEEDEELVLGDDGEAITAASIFCETVKNRADVSVSQGDSIVGFADLLCLTPRGRFEVDLYATFFRLRGKSHDYRILYSSIKRLFCLPKPDDLHYNFVIELNPPLRQGQTRYPFLVFQFDRDDDVEATVKLDEETLEKQYEGRLKKEYDGPVFSVLSEVFKALTNIKVIVPSGSFQSAQSLAGLKCSLKANEAFLFPLEKSFISLPKPTTLISHADVTLVTFGRVNASASSSTKTFEMRIATQATEFTYSSIPREEYENLDAYCRAKKLKVTTDIGDGAPNYAEDDDDDDDASDGEDRKRKRTIIQNIGDIGDEDEDESEDEDYVDKSSDDSDPDLEFDSDAKSDSDADSDEEDDKSKKGKGKAAAKPKDEKKEKKPAAVKKEKDDKSVSSKKKKPAGDDDGPAKKKVKKEDGEAKPKTAASRKKEKEGSPSKEKVKSSEFVDSDDE